MDYNDECESPVATGQTTLGRIDREDEVRPVSWLEYRMDNQLYDNLALCARAIRCPVRRDIGQGSRILAVFGID